jgi:class 3 adenylate cyclase
MADQELYFCWEWDLQAAPEAMWPFFADTNRVNQDTGFFPVQERPGTPLVGLENGRSLRYRLPLGIPLNFEEQPFEWIYPFRYGVLRYFPQGPVEMFRVVAEFSALPNGGCHLVYEAWVKPRNIIGRLGAKMVLGVAAPPRFSKALRRYDAVVVSEFAPYVPTDARLSQGAAARLEQARTELLNQGFAPRMVDELCVLIRSADDLTLARIRPYAFADWWGEDRRTVLEMFLWATRVGLLDFQWEVLCPMCRNPEDRVSNRLADVHSNAHCNSCNIDFSTNFENSVELTFAPNPAIRDIHRLTYCVGGPVTTPHVVAQQILQPGERRTITPMLANGRYRIRAMGIPEETTLRVASNIAEAQPAATITAQSNGWSAQEEPILTPSPDLTLDNQTEHPLLLVMERIAWNDQATTAADVLVLQRFRDLFANEALRAGEQIGVGSLTVLFTDLVDSTRMYREIGDAPAFGIVMNHFDVLKEAIDAEEGAIVKTIGDAVMAVFRRPISAVRAMARAQAILSNPDNGQRPLHLKAAIHTGPSIAVTLNQRLDYFGTNINIAARLEKFSGGNEMILSDATYTDPEVREYLHDPYEAYNVEPFDEMLKGFDDERFHLWRICKQKA